MQQAERDVEYTEHEAAKMCMHTTKADTRGMGMLGACGTAQTAGTKQTAWGLSSSAHVALLSISLARSDRHGVLLELRKKPLLA